MDILDTLKQKVEKATTNVEDTIHPQSSHVSEEVEKPAETPSTNDRSAYNCPECKGEGIVNEEHLCPLCKGTGKV